MPESVRKCETCQEGLTKLPGSHGTGEIGVLGCRSGIGWKHFCKGSDMVVMFLA